MRTYAFDVLRGFLLLGVFFFSLDLLAATRGGCGRALVEKARPRVFDLSDGIHVIDPLGQIDRNAPFAVALGEYATQKRLAFLARRTSRRDGRIKIVLHRHDTHVFRSWIEAERWSFTYEDWQSPHPVIVEWADWQDENAEVLFFGAVVEASLTLLAESPLYREHLEVTLDEAFERIRSKADRWKQGSNADGRDHDALQSLLADGTSLRWQTMQVFHLRTTWMAKIHFYRRELPAHPELAFVDGVPSAATLRQLATLDEAVENTPWATAAYDRASQVFEDRFRAEFTALYSQHDGYRLSPALVRAVWTAAQPRLLESSLVCPEMLLGPGLFP